MTTQSNFSRVPRLSVVERAIICRLREFVRMNPPIFLGSKMVEDLI